MPTGREMEGYQAQLAATNGQPPFLWTVLHAIEAWGWDDGQMELPALIPDDVTAVAAGLNHGLALHRDGTVTGWGLAVPGGLNNVTAIAAGGEHALALRYDGTVVAWGNNDHGQADIPPGLTNVTAISAGAIHSLALRVDGTVCLWGDGDYGQKAAPPSLSNVVAIAAGGYHNLALRSNGTVVAWGYDWSGQAQVPAGLDSVAAIAAGCMHSLALLTNGTVAAWGDDLFGQRTLPGGLSNVVAIAGGGYHSLALFSNETVAAWGNNWFGQATVPAALGRAQAIAGGMYSSLAVPAEQGRLPPALACSTNGSVTGVPVLVSSNDVAFAVRDAAGTVARKTLPIVIAFNANARPVIGSATPPSGEIVMGEGGSRAFSILAADPEGSNLIYRWTLNGAEVGGNSNVYTHVADWGDAGRYGLQVWVSDGVWTGVVSAAWTLTVVADADGDGMADGWEARYFGDGSRNGDGDYDGDGATDRTEYQAGTDPTAWPVGIATAALPAGMEAVPYNFQLAATNGVPPLSWAVSPMYPVVGWGGTGAGQTIPPPGLSDAVAVAAGAGHSLAVRRDGTVTAWGANSFGQAAVPSGLSGVAAVAGGLTHSLALRSNGTVVSWGGSPGIPWSVPGGLSGVIAIAAGWEHSLALLSNGTVRAWGNNTEGQATVPAGLSNVTAISAGAYHSLALLSNGTVRAWGNNTEGQVTVPAGLSNVTAISAGAYHNLALGSNRTVAAWGFNEWGQTSLPAGLSNAVAVAAGGSHSLALCGDGALLAWGDSSEGQTAVPMGLTNAVALAAGMYHSLALRAVITCLPAGLSFSTNGLLSGIPAQAGTCDVTFAVFDGQGTEARRSMRLAIGRNTNERPVIDKTDPETGQMVVVDATNGHFSVEAHDPESMALRYDWLWDGAIVGSNSPLFRLTTEGRLPGTHSLRCYVSDDLWTNLVYAQWTVMLSEYVETNIWQGSVSADWFNPGNWSLGFVPALGAKVLVPAGATQAPVLTNATAALAELNLTTNQTLTLWGWSSSLTAREMTLGGMVTHATNWLAATNGSGEWIPLHRVWLVGSNITLAAKGKIDVSNRGYVTNSGPGRAADGSGHCSPGHSGTGRRGRSGGVPGPAYDDPAAPVQPGSGGNSNATSGFGGGAVRIEASGRLTVEGTITANGQHALGTHGAGGSGGSIWLSCRTLAGSTNGLIGADGGNGNYYGAPAAPGRMAVTYDRAAQASLPEPCPLIRFSGKPGVRGSNPNSEMLPPDLGTLYFPDASLLGYSFTGKRFQYTKLVIPGLMPWAFYTLTLNDCIIGLPDGFQLTVNGDLLLTNGAALYMYATPTADPVNMAGALVEVRGSLRVSSNSWIHPHADPTNGAVVQVTVAENLELANGGGINADYKGYTYGQGPGSPTNIRGGGAYGGAGGQGYDGFQGGRIYGSETGPIQAGSGGGQNPAVGGQGGGAIRLSVGGRAIIQGTLTAIGAPGVADHGPGGSGGGISIVCRTFEGSASGLLRVDGGLGSYYGGSGSGGRIAIGYDSTAQAALPDPRPPVRLSAFAYPYTTTDSYANPAEPGSLYFPDLIPLMASPTSAVSWTGQRLWHVRLAVPGFTNWAPASLTLSNCAVRLPDGFRLNVAGDLTMQSGSIVRLHANPSAGADPYGAWLSVGGDLSIQTNAWIQPYAQPTHGTRVRLRVEGNARIESGGGIDADWKGYCPVPGNTNGPGPGRDANSGGGYGGQGGGLLGGVTNGSAILPLAPGSPGGWRARGDGWTSAHGGGAIHLFVNGNLTVNGTLTASGGVGGYYRGPGGSGGSILVTARRLDGSGLLRAAGGNCNAGSGSGGGGRIAVWDRLGPDEAELMITNPAARRLFALPAHDIFTGAFQVEGGSASNAGATGTAGFYRKTPAFQTVIWIM